MFFSTELDHPTEIPLESTRIERRSGDYGDISISTTDNHSTLEPEVDRTLDATFTTDTTYSSTATVNEDPSPALDASFDLTVHGAVQEEEVCEE